MKSICAPLHATRGASGSTRGCLSRVAAVPVDELLRGHEQAWRRATRHPFLERVRAGTLPEDAFAVWLVQDRLFVGDLLCFQARLLARAPRCAQRVLAAGALALVDELVWFDAQGERLGLDLEAERLPATYAYRTLLERLEREPFEAAITALWVLERVYLDAWSFAAPAAPPYDAFVEHWTTPEFRAYVDELEALADPSHDEVVAAVLEAEIAFWETTLT
jgi:formylaminopyrimidine deformylase / aminopyrimidine aminohydrolase